MSIIHRILLAVLLIFPATADAGALTELLEVLISRGAKIAGRTTVEETVLGSRTIGKTMLDQPMSGTLIRREAESTISRMIAASPPNKVASRVDALESILTRVHAGVDDLNYTASFDDAFPFIRIRATANPWFNDALTAFARAKFDPMLAERFSVDDLRIIPLGMSEDAEVSAMEVARYNRWIPSAQQDRVGPLAQFAEGAIGQINEKRVREMLVPYRGKTVVLVGHVPNDTQAFFVNTAEGMKPIDLNIWMKAADAAEVNVIPLGCNSGRFAPIGASQKINSDDVLQRLLYVINRNPSTILDFLKVLSGEDLILLLDPTNLNIFNNTIKIMRKETGEVVGRVVRSTGPPASRALSELVAFRKDVPNYDVSVEVEADFFALMELEGAEDEKRKEQRAQADRVRRIAELPEQISAAQQSVEAAAYNWALTGLVYLTLWASALLVVPWALLVTREQKETGKSFGNLTADRRFLAKLMKSIARPLFWTGNIELLFVLLPQLVLGIIILMASSQTDHFLFGVALSGALVLGILCIMLLVEYEINSAGALVIAATLIWLCSGVFYYGSYDSFWHAKTRAAELTTELYAYTHAATPEPRAAR